jgi:hypothetical protein
LSFHKIFRLRLVLTPVSTSGKNSRIPFNGTLPKPTAVSIGFEPFSPESPSSTLLCSVPEIIELHKHKYSNGKGGLGIFVCVPPFYLVLYSDLSFLCLSSLLSLYDIFIYFGYGIFLVYFL